MSQSYPQVIKFCGINFCGTNFCGNNFCEFVYFSQKLVPQDVSNLPFAKISSAKSDQNSEKQKRKERQANMNNVSGLSCSLTPALTI